MSYFVILQFLFFMGSFIGWIIELVYRKWFGAHNPEHRWINPGFLTGPYLPLYGFGLTLLYLIAGLPNPFNDNEIAGKVFIFVIMAVVMTLIEYIAGIIFIKGLHVQLWDYNKEWGNIQGIICPKFSFFWALLGAGYYFLVHPHILDSLKWLSENLTFCLVIGFFYGVFSVDLVYTFNLVTKIRRFAVEKNIVVKYEGLKSDIRLRAERKKEKIMFLFAFKSEISLKEHLEKYLEVVYAFKLGNKEDHKNKDIKKEEIQ